MPISQAAQFNHNFARAEYQLTRYVLRVPADLKFEELLKPSFWSHVGSLLRQDDEVVVIADDRTWKAQLAVVEAGHLFAKVAVDIPRHSLEVKLDDSEPLIIEPLNGKFRVRRGPDVLKDGLVTKKDAERWVADYGTQKAA